MATIKLKFRPSVIEGKEGTLIYQVTHQRVVRCILTDYHILASEWNARRFTILVRGTAQRQSYLHVILSKVRWEKRQLLSIILEKERLGVEYTADDVVESFTLLPACQTVFRFIGEQEKMKRRLGRVGTAKTYRDVLHSFFHFRNGEDIVLNTLSWEIIDSYEAWLKTRGLKRNSTSCYLRTFRTLYRKAVEKGLTEDNKVFRHAYTGFAKTTKRAISLSNVKALRQLMLPYGSMEAFTRDLFLLSFYLRGMSFIDIAYLKKTDLQNGTLRYIRRKTGQPLTIKWELPMREIVEAYAHLTVKTPYLLPIITKVDGTERKQYVTMEQRVNRNLKSIARRLGFTMPLTTYVARHTWASTARDMGCPLSVISEGMGHDSLRTTQIYLSTIDTDSVDRINGQIISKLLG